MDSKQKMNTIAGLAAEMARCLRLVWKKLDEIDAVLKYHDGCCKRPPKMHPAGAPYFLHDVMLGTSKWACGPGIEATPRHTFAKEAAMQCVDHLNLAFQLGYDKAKGELQ